MGPPHPDRVPSVRVLLVGDAGVGKTSLAQLLAAGAAPAEAPMPTHGCDVFVRLVQVPDPAGGAPRPHFVELWDVGADAAHAALRPLFYSQVAGVILVHDLTRRRGAAGLAAWASELATSASFAPGALAGGAGGAPPSALAAHLRDLGLPVPALVVGTKADVAERRRRSALGAWLSASAAAAVAPARRCVRGLRSAAAHRGLGRPPRPSGGALLPEFATRQEREAQLFAAATLRSAAALGRVDMLAVDAFFRALLAARIPTGGHSRNVSSSSAPGSPGSRWAGMSGDVMLAEVPSFSRRLDALLAGPDAPGRDGRLAWPDEEEGGAARGPGGERALWSP